ncbi:GNAT family N-acetyltransferase [Lacticaseibacillus zhaodongensis]|uniref:GNAT family N-acetyltransferase n=1 Tax=Lacticaseibacillus zhaodongensis TaxID=2668065 RepID=UPI0018AFBB34|nr:GNAT family N-acetyltransferase [Lacticaseibacillus zhaodongensis]
MLKKELVIVRPIELTDAAAYLHYTQQPEVYVPAAVIPPLNVAAARTRLQEFVGGDQMYAIVLPESGQMIGDVGIYYRIAEDGGDDPQHRELGYELDPQFWGHGYATAALARILSLAFEKQGVARIKADVYVDNVVSLHLLQKFGFREATRGVHLPPALQQHQTALSEQFLDRTDWLKQH